ncbi:unnamed protein product [Nesidiocoris tenuis]|uniref:Pleiotrophin/Midkine C-terminal domain-containing protein n=1 Tax=Nesidiocoris tenuis TaxID=355587 RepID=A0A6H5H2B0_9HEMI|nr:unnamed protein product [Nesidiocoris tenuis]
MGYEQYILSPTPYLPKTAHPLGDNRSPLLPAKCYVEGRCGDKGDMALPIVNIDPCRYVKGPWSDCDTKTNTRSRMLTLKKKDGTVSANCEPTKTIQKKCKKACRYEKGAWSACSAQNEMVRTDTLKEKSDPSCEQKRVTTKKCKNNKTNRPNKAQKSSNDKFGHTCNKKMENPLKLHLLQGSRNNRNSISEGTIQFTRPRSTGEIRERGAASTRRCAADYFFRRRSAMHPHERARQFLAKPGVLVQRPLNPRRPRWTQRPQHAGSSPLEAARQ